MRLENDRPIFAIGIVIQRQENNNHDFLSSFLPQEYDEKDYERLSASVPRDTSFLVSRNGGIIYQRKIYIYKSEPGGFYLGCGPIVVRL